MANCQFASVHGDGCPYHCTRCGFVSQSDSLVIECPAHAHLPQRPVTPTLALCRHCGGEARRQLCPDCPGSVQVKIFRCALHGECTHSKQLDGVACCARCPDFSAHAGQPAANV